VDSISNKAPGRGQIPGTGPFPESGVVASAMDARPPAPPPERHVVEADRLVVLGSLAAGVAHEISNALTGARLMVGRLLTLELSQRPPTPLQEHRIEMLQEVRESFSRVERIVSGLRRLSSVDADEPLVAVDLAEVLDSVARVASHEIAHRARLACDYGPVPQVLGRRGQLEQLFLNLLINAVQAIPEGSAHENTIRLVTRTDVAGRIVVEVVDTGEGILPENLPRIFDPFFTTKPPSRGFGLGLSVARDIVESLGGEIAAESAGPRGTTLRVVLPPMSSAPVPVPRPAARPHVPHVPHARPIAGQVARVEEPRWPVGEARAKGMPVRLLVVDDDPMVARAISFALDYEVVLASSGREAQQILGSDRRFDAVLCDLMMPEVTGMDLFDAIARTDPELAGRFVFMTGGAFTARARRFIASVPNPHIEKPFQLGTLRAFVRAAIKDESDDPSDADGGMPGGLPGEGPGGGNGPL
jgi:two-component system cell cycle sensor histidine kinase/response regulator CckA